MALQQQPQAPAGPAAGTPAWVAALAAQPASGLNANPLAGLEAAPGSQYGGGQRTANPNAGIQAPANNASYMGALSSMLSQPAPTASPIAAVHAATVGQATPAAPAGPSLAQVIQAAVLAAVGQAPSAVTADSAGPAPVLSNYWDPTPYTQAAQAVQAGGATGTSTVNNAYAQALQSALTQGRSAQADANAVGQQAQQDASTAGNNEHAAIATALQGASPNSLQANELNAQQQTLNQNNQRGVQSANFLSGMVGANNSANQTAIGASKANALQYLNAQVQGELSKIGLAEGSAQSTAQRTFGSALDAYNTSTQNAKDTAANDTANNQAKYAAAYDAALKQVQGYATSLSQDGRDAVMAQVNGGTLPSGLSNAFTNTIFGTASAGNGAAKDLPDALSRIQSGSASLVSQGVNVDQLSNLVTQYYQTTKTPPTPSALEAYLSANGGATG